VTAISSSVAFVLRTPTRWPRSSPSVENERAIRSYAAVGFKPVGVLRSYGRNPEGGWHDGLLMDLIVLEGKWS
jgi:hypothetical protein